MAVFQQELKALATRFHTKRVGALIREVLVDDFVQAAGEYVIDGMREFFIHRKKI